MSPGHGHGGHGHGRHFRASLGFVPGYWVESCDPSLDPYCSPHAVFGGPEETLNTVGNAAGLMALGRGALVLGGIGLAGYGLYHFTHKVPKKGITL
jgi:hypothetical protein